MSPWCYLLAAVSGILYGVFELIRAYPRMKRKALGNLWAIAYLVGSAVMGMGAILLLKEKEVVMVKIFAHQAVNDAVLAVLAGPLTSFCLRHFGAKGKKGEKDLVSVHDRIFSFLRDEIQHAVDVARVELSGQIANRWADRMQELKTKAIDYVNAAPIDAGERARRLKYVNGLVPENDRIILSRYLIENYGEPWVRRHLL